MSIGKKIAFYTLGCKVNQYETDSIRNKLVHIGYEEVPFDEKADIYIINSCTVTGVADRKSRNFLRRARSLNPHSIVILTGCYAQTDAEKLSHMPEIDHIIGNSYKDKIPELLAELEKNIENNIKTCKIDNEDIFKKDVYTELDFSSSREMSRAYIKIQDGCNNFCSYCKIPFARGKSRSRSKDNIISEIRKIHDEGYKEVILIGIDLSEYGYDLLPQISFEDLIDDIFKANIIDRIRIGSVYPDKITDKYIALFDDKRLMPHLHVSLQSCDDHILHQMHRKYDSGLIYERLMKLKNNIENIELTGDVIVGFPGETEEMFMNTYNMINDISFSGLHIFPYSDREGTVASKMPDKIPSTIKRQRVQRLEKLRDIMAIRERNKYIDKDLSVLWEEEKNGYSYGYSENYLRVRSSKKEKVNTITTVKIKSSEKEMLLTDGTNSK